VEKENSTREVSKSKEGGEGKVYNSASVNQLGIFGDGWIYRRVQYKNKLSPHPTDYPVFQSSRNW